jgi:8-oxo-dGTP pyrophosphatase MutT (NUDIX family)
MKEVDDILAALLEDEDDLSSKDVFFPNDPKAVDFSEPLAGNEAKLRRVFTWLTRLGMTPAFGSVPIGWYQQAQFEAIDRLRALAKLKGIDLRWVKKKNEHILAYHQDRWVPIAKFGWRDELVAEAMDDDFDMKEVTGGAFDELAQLVASGVLDLSGKVERGSSRYVHERSTTFELYNSYNWPDDMPQEEREAEEVRIDKLISELEKYVSERIVAWNHKIYQELEKDYEWAYEDENIADTLEANDYHFTEDGERDDEGPFTYQQLQPDAQEAARQWWKDANEQDNWWSESTIAEWKWLLDQKGFLGVEIAFSGFWSQGDGASFEAKRFDAAQFFKGVDPLDFPEQDREQMSESQEDDIHPKDLATTNPEDVASEILRLVTAIPGVTDVTMTRGAVNPEHVIINGKINLDHWDAGYAIDKAIFPVMENPAVEITRHTAFAAPMDKYPRGFAVVVKPALRESLLERYGGAEKERQIFYHGTTSTLLPKILAQGLIPNPKVRSWSDDPHKGLIQPSRQSLEGIYVTTNLMTAVSAAGRVARRDKAHRLIVVMELQPRDLLADEDDIGGTINALANHISDHVYSHIWPYFAEVYRDRMRYAEEYAPRADQAKAKWVDDAAKQMLYKFGQNRPELETRLRELLANEGYRIMLTRMASYAGDWEKGYWHSEWRHLFGTDEDAPPVPDKNQAEADFLAFKDKLTRTLKGKARPLMQKDWKLNVSGRSMKPIGFDGSDRIICIVEEIDHSGPEYYTGMIVHYGKPPEQLIKDWTESHGPLDKPDSIVYKNAQQEAFETHGQALARTGEWGTQAAGGVYIAQDTGRVLIGFRSSDVLKPHTWGTFGGAMDEGEDAATAAQREMKEETGYSGPMEMKLVYVFEKGTFKYHNFAVIVPAEFKPRLNWENDDAEWFEPGKWPSPLHPGMDQLLSRLGAVQESEDDDFDVKEVAKVDDGIFVNYTYDSHDPDGQYEQVWEDEGPFVSMQSAYEWAQKNLSRDKIAELNITREVLGSVTDKIIVDQFWGTWEKRGEQTVPVNISEAADDDFETKEIAEFDPDPLTLTRNFMETAYTTHGDLDRFMTKLSEVVDWPQLYAAYPRMADMPVKLYGGVPMQIGWAVSRPGTVAGVNLEPGQTVFLVGRQAFDDAPKRLERRFAWAIKCALDVLDGRNPDKEAAKEWAARKTKSRWPDDYQYGFESRDPDAVVETAEDDFEVKDVGLPGQNWTYHIFRFPTAAAINYFVVEDPAFKHEPFVTDRTGDELERGIRPRWPNWDKLGKTVGGHTFPRRMPDKELHQIAQAQIRQFLRAGEFPRQGYRDVWEWMRDVRDTGKPHDPLPWDIRRRGNTYRQI